MYKTREPLPPWNFTFQETVGVIKKKDLGDAAVDKN